MDLISRQAAIDEVRNYYDPEDTSVTSIEDRIKRLPSVQSERWIPVTERLPKNDALHIITVCDESGDRPYVYTSFGWYLEEAKCWIVDNDWRRDVTAWAVLPTPYKWRQ